jgi:hypothetical protein
VTGAVRRLVCWLTGLTSKVVWTDIGAIAYRSGCGCSICAPSRRGWTDIDAIVYRSRTTPESSLNYAFFGDDAFDVESWRFAKRIDTLTALVLHHSFTVNWDLNGD